MVKKIRTLEDLIEVSGTAAAELGKKKTSKTNMTVSSKVSESSKTSKKSYNSTKKLLDQDDYNFTGKLPSYEELFPINFDELRKEPYLINGFHRKMTTKKIQNIIDNAPARSAKFEAIYNQFLEGGVSSRGYKIVSINILREADALKKYLEDLSITKEKLDDN